MSTNPVPELTGIAGLLSNPDLTDEQRDVYVAMSQGTISPEEAIRQVMALESSRNESSTAGSAPAGGGA